MGAVIMLWFAVMGIYYLCVVVLRLALKLPAAVVFVLTLPAMPFIAAYRNRTEHPVRAKAICWMWGMLYVLWGIIIMADGHL